MPLISSDAATQGGFWLSVAVSFFSISLTVIGYFREFQDRGAYVWSFLAHSYQLTWTNENDLATAL